MFQNLTDTDSSSVFFVFICDLNSCISEDKSRAIILEVLIKSKRFDRLDLSAKLNCRNKDLKKQVSFLKLKILINQILL